MTKPICLCGQDYFISLLNTVTVEKRNNQDSFPLHQHDFYEIVIVTAGNGIHSWNDEIHTITCGDILYINHDDIHGYKSVNNLQLDNILYQRDKLSIAAVIEKYLPSKLADLHARFWRIHPSNLKSLSSLIEQMRVASKKNNTASIHFTEALLLQLVIFISQCRYQPNSTISELSHQLDVLFTVLHKSIDQSFNLENFCKQYHISSRSLTRTFKNQTSMTISEYLQKLKLGRAMHLLRNTQYSISSIANECGYNDSNYFATSFKKLVQLTPSEYRNKYKKILTE